MNSGTTPIKWRVLSSVGNGDSYRDASGEPYTGDSRFLLSESLLDDDTPFDIDTTEQQRHSKAWQGSSAQAWCRDFAGESGAEANVADAFSPSELAVILATTKSDAGFTSSTNAVPFAASNNILDGDRVFFLSAKEIERSDYGFLHDASRIAMDYAGARVWWLRSPYGGADGTIPTAGVVYQGGDVQNQSVILPFWVRPAFNLDLSAVLLTSAAVDGKASGLEGPDALTPVSTATPTEWKLTLPDSSRSRFTITTTALDSASVSVEYADAKTGTNEYISTMIVDSSGNVLYYGRVKNLPNATDASGVVTVNIPAGVTLGTNATLKMFNEQYNDDYKTDYASDLKTVTDPPIGVAFTSLTADGITVTGATKGALTKVAATGEYTLAISDITVADGEEVNVAVSTSGYRCTPAAMNVAVRKHTPPTPATYTVTYDANGGSGTMASGTATDGLAFTLPACTFTAPTGKLFKAWAIGSASGTRVAAGSDYTFTADTAVYAVWEQTGSIGGTITNDDTPPLPVVGATVTVYRGNVSLASSTTGNDGAFTFTGLPYGVYSLVGNKGAQKVTRSITVGAGSANGDMVLPTGQKNTVVETVVGTPPVAANGLNEQFNAPVDDDTKGVTQADLDTVTAGGSVELKLTATLRTAAEVQEDINKINDALGSGGQLALLVDFTLAKTVISPSGNRTTSILTQLPELIEVIIELPDNLRGNSNIRILRVHKGVAQELPKNAGVEYYTLDDDYAHLFVKCFSTYAIALSNTPAAPIGGEDNPLANFDPAAFYDQYVQPSAAPTAIPAADVPATGGAPWWVRVFHS